MDKVIGRILPVVFVIGLLLIVLALAETIPAAADAIVGNPDWRAFAQSSALTLIIGVLLSLSSYRPNLQLDRRQSFKLTVGSWIVLSLFGAIPFKLANLDLTMGRAVFESVSGLTTTGSTVLVGLDHMPPGVLVWRALLQWLGGIGIVAMALLMLPFLRIGGMQLFHMESSDRSEKVMPRSVGIIIGIAVAYMALTLLCALAYRLAGMTGFEATLHAMTTVSTGGYSTSDGSIGHFDSNLIDWIAVVFMIAASLPFVLYVRVFSRRHTRIWRDSQVIFFLSLLAVATTILTLWLWILQNVSVGEALTQSAFNVVSIVTTTGYATRDYGQWGTFPVMLFFVLTVLGGCTGSTAGGIKAMRLQVAWIAIREEAIHLAEPRRVLPRTYNGRPLPQRVVESVMIMVLVYALSVQALALGLSLTGLDWVTSLSGALTAIANVGPGLGQIIGPAGNFSTLSDSAEWMLTAGMLLGRLEFLTVFVVFSWRFWTE